jgi:lysyl-tRNA synthetase class 2
MPSTPETAEGRAEVAAADARGGAAAAGSHEAEVMGGRREKLARLRDAGVDPFPRRFPDRTEIATIHAAHADLTEPGEYPDHRYRIAGRVTGERGHGKTVFLDVIDRSGQLQVYARRDAIGDDEFEAVQALDVGDIAGFEGAVYVTKRGQLALQVESATLLTKSLRPPPDGYHGVKDTELRARRRELDLIANEESRDVFIKRAKTVSALRRYFDDHGFIEIETPTLQPLYGGANARPFITHHNTLGEDRYLRISPECFLKRAVVGGLESVYDFGKCFRNEGISPQHNPEFTVVEWTEAYKDSSEAMDFTERMVAYAAEQVLGTTKVERAGETIDLAPPWRRVTLRDAVLDATGVDVYAASDEELRQALGEDAGDDATRADLIGKLFSKFVESTLIQPTFVLDFPAELCQTAKLHTEQEGFVDNFDAVVGGVEIATGGAENNDPDEQRRIFTEQLERAQGEHVEGANPLDEEFLEALEIGMLPSAGAGLGIDRLVMLLTGADSLREVVLFPALRRLDQS